MTSNLSQFHYLASTVPNKFDFEAEDFDVSQIYQFYSLKVSKKYSRATGVYSLKLQRFSDLFPLLCLQHQRTPVSLFLDRMFARKLADFSLNKADYEQLYVRTKTLANVAQQ